MDEENIEVAHGQTILEQGEKGSGFIFFNLDHWK